jgi:hypothetical protein
MKTTKTHSCLLPWEREIIETPLTLIFEEFMSNVPQEFEWAETIIDELLEDFWAPETSNDNYYIQLLQNTKQSLWETNEMNSVLIQLRELIDTTPELLDSQLSQKTYDLIESLWWEIVIESFGGSEYETAKSNIVWLLNEPYKQQVLELFGQFEQVQDNKEQAKMILDQIFTITWQARDAWVNDSVDFTYIQSSLCDIIIYFELPSRTCGTVDDTIWDNSDTTNDDSWSSWRSVIRTILRRVIGIVIVLAVWIWAMILIFAIKARKRQQEENDTE